MTIPSQAMLRAERSEPRVWFTAYRELPREARLESHNRKPLQGMEQDKGVQRIRNDFYQADCAS
jgi:hypothetical protein